jgi:hypothetical protein
MSGNDGSTQAEPGPVRLRLGISRPTDGDLSVGAPRTNAIEQVALHRRKPLVNIEAPCLNPYGGTLLDPTLIECHKFDGLLPEGKSHQDLAIR